MFWNVLDSWIQATGIGCSVVKRRIGHCPKLLIVSIAALFSVSAFSPSARKSSHARGGRDSQPQCQPLHAACTRATERNHGKFRASARYQERFLYHPHCLSLLLIRLQAEAKPSSSSPSRTAIFFRFAYKLAHKPRGFGYKS